MKGVRCNMNPALLIIVGIGAILLWFLCAWLYKPIGSIIVRLFNDSKRAMFDEKMKEDKGE